jgi:hypothetical protein
MAIKILRKTVTPCRPFHIRYPWILKRLSNLFLRDFRGQCRDSINIYTETLNLDTIISERLKSESVTGPIPP